MDFPRKDVTESALFYYSSCYGAVGSIALLLGMLGHVSYHYVRIFHSSSGSGDKRIQQSKFNYVLFFVIAFLALWSCVMFAFVRTNLLTGQAAESISLTQCAVGYYGAFGCVQLELTLVFVVLLYRVQQSFKQSVYEYSARVYTMLYIFLIVPTLFFVASLAWSYNDTVYVLEWFDDEQQVYCASTEAEDTSTINKAVRDFVTSLVVVVVQFAYNLILLYMFTNRLYQLQSDMVEAHVDEKKMVSRISSSGLHLQVGVKSISELSTPSAGPVSPPEIPDTINENSINEHSMEMSNRMSRRQSISRSVTVGQIAAEMKGNRSRSNAAKRIFALHALIKQHTVLILLIVLSAVLWGLLLGILGDRFYPQILYLSLTNVICLWLMLKTAEPYWNFSKKFCICGLFYCSYCENERDINAKCCGVFFC